ncbi:hypothetical protein [African swine fever virus]|uniref:Uncharacterized protein n=1 Tax=African swine fever virus TaxID=10497 RepID=A0A3G1EV59_ASF|nr:hypothetical protein F8221_gp147 [African swine fever virus]AOO54452.1 hypothetical protein AFSV47Ss_0147 [African swine fever virus]QIM06788.1 hypothetical protein [African swine fever virus]QIM07023.1 hypothetical protein [African swine fever virus]QIM07258.1 hypothetical protein [African swine fever virus]QIM07493.1 hypothetical protein [African swine fever virus]
MLLINTYGRFLQNVLTIAYFCRILFSSKGSTPLVELSRMFFTMLATFTGTCLTSVSSWLKLKFSTFRKICRYLSLSFLRRENSSSNKGDCIPVYLNLSSSSWSDSMMVSNRTVSSWRASRPSSPYNCCTRRVSMETRR